MLFRSSSNFAVQNADLIISFGSKLDTKSTGTPVTTFAREAWKCVIDIDEFELKYLVITILIPFTFLLFAVGVFLAEGASWLALRNF